MPPTLSTYYDALTIGRMGVYLGNSILYAAAVLVVQLFIDSLAAYSFARVDFPGRETLFLAVLATLMLPGSVTLIPTFLIAHGLGLTNTFTGVVLPGFAGAFGIFLLRQFFLNIPRELEDAARIDGSGFFGTYWRIMLPLAKPAMVYARRLHLPQRVELLRLAPHHPLRLEKVSRHRRHRPLPRRQPDQLARRIRRLHHRLLPHRHPLRPRPGIHHRRHQPLRPERIRRVGRPETMK